MKPEVLVSAAWLLAVAAVPLLVGCGGSKVTGSSPPAGGTTTMMGGGRGRMMGPGMRGRGGMMMGGSMERHRLAMMYGLPASYQELRNPLPASTRVLAEGRTLFQAHCSACHGETGEGNGPAADGMVPPPSSLRWVMSRPMAWDAYLMWSISEGGAALGSSMPAYKDTLGESDRWRIIHYLRTL
jgi:mono/diheme cytochrome c family protein